MTNPSKEAKLALSLAVRERLTESYVELTNVSFFQTLIGRFVNLNPEDPPGEEFIIARPYLLRSVTRTHAGVSFISTGFFTRQAQLSTTIEQHQIRPAYEVGDLIKVAFHNEVVQHESTLNLVIRYLDLNVDARAWVDVTS